MSALSAMGRSSQDLAALERDAKAQDASPVLALEEPETATTDFSAGANALAAETPEQPAHATAVEDAGAFAFATLGSSELIGALNMY